jgi:multidrug efflux pump subunit AcrB
MKKVIYIFLSRPVTTAMSFFLVIVLGIASIFNIPLELSPEVEYPKLSVSASWYGVSPEAVEAFLTSPLEALLATVKGVQKISSRSSEGQSYIDIEFHPSTDMDFARVEINEKLGMLKNELPYGVSQPRLSAYVPKDFKELQGFLTFTLTADRSANEIRKYALENLVTPLMSINGVSEVEVRGGNEREINITINYDKVRLFGISNEKISTAINDAEKILSAGTINQKDKRESIQIKNEVSVTEILNYQPINLLTDGTVIRLKDIGLVSDDFKERTSYYRINGKEAVFLEIDKEPGAKTIETADKVFTKLDELAKNFPSGFLLNKELDRSEDIRKELNGLFSNAVYSLIIIIVLLIFIFRKLSYSLIIVTSIVFSLLSALLLLYLFDLSLNIITIASLVLGFGLMVDNSVVVIDHLDKHYQGRGIKYLAIHTKEIFSPIFASTFTTAAVFIPLLFLTGELRLYFEQFALAIVFSIIASLFVSFAVVPILFSKFGFHLAEGGFKNKSTRNSFFYKSYEFIQYRIFKFKKLSIGLLILVVGIPVWLLPNRIETPIVGDIYNVIFDSDFYNEHKKYVNYALGGALNLFFNHIQKGEVFSYGATDYIIVRLKLPNGNKIERINDLTKKFEREILAYRRNFANLTANVLNEENAYLRIEFTKDQSGTAFPYLLKNYLTAYAVQLGGLNVSIFGYGPGFSSGGYLSYSYVVKVSGFNFNKVRTLAEEFRNIISTNPRIDNVDIDRSARYGFDEDTYEIVGNLKRNQLDEFDINANEIFDAVSKNTRGNISYNRFRIGNEEVRYNIKYSNYQQMQLKDIEEMPINNLEKQQLKVKDLVDFNQRKLLSNINREDRQYVRYISFDYKGPYQYGREFLESSIKQMRIPESYEIKSSFGFWLREEDEIEIWKILFISALLILMITASLFESVKKPLLIILAIPFAIIGVIYFFHFEDLSLDRGAYAGMLLLIGVSVNNSIVLVNYLSKNLKKLNVDEIIKLSFIRIRPILTTTLTTIAALLPIILLGEESFWKSLSYSVLSGLSLSTIFTILFIPLIFHMIAQRKTKNDGNFYYESL